MMMIVGRTGDDGAQGAEGREHSDMSDIQKAERIVADLEAKSDPSGTNEGGSNVNLLCPV